MTQCFLVLRGLVLFSVALALASCGGLPRVPFTEPMKISKQQELDSAQLEAPKQAPTRSVISSSQGPQPPMGRSSSEPILSTTPPRLTGEPVTVKFEGIRLPAFINTIFGEVLRVPFEIDSSLAQKDSVIVTLSTGDTSLPRDAFYRMVTEVLANYGVSIIYANNIYRIVETSTTKQPIPRILRSRANATMPTELRPVFLFKAVNNVATTTMTIWLNLTLKDRVQTVNIPMANGLLLLGGLEDVNSAVEIIETLDQPYLAGSRSLKISPAFWSAQRLSAQLVDILTAEGYSVGTGGSAAVAIKLIPVEALNVIIAFGTGEDTLRHVLEWATELDQPSQTVSTQGAFYHQVYNAKAKDLADTIRGLVETTVTQTQANPAADARAPAMSTSSTRQRIMVDEARNGLIFVGTAEEYAQFRSLMQQMDRAPLQVMIEATIAEVTLRQGESLGIVFDYDDGRPNAVNQKTVRSSEGGIFFSLVRDHGSIISRVNALADMNRLQVLSSPRLVTSSGKEATINVGTQVPIITSQETAAGQVQGNTSILQAIQYRNTGVILNVQPTINSSRRVELIVTQEVSAAQENSLSGVQSPVIVNRSLQTTLSLDDGETVLLGGMIQENFSNGNSGIPYLKDIPVLGNLFKTQSQSINRTELIVLMTPYIIDGSETARQIRDSFRSKLGEWAEPVNAEPPTPAAAPSAN